MLSETTMTTTHFLSVFLSFGSCFFSEQFVATSLFHLSWTQYNISSKDGLNSGAESTQEDMPIYLAMLLPYHLNCCSHVHQLMAALLYWLGLAFLLKLWSLSFNLHLTSSRYDGCLATAALGYSVAVKDRTWSRAATQIVAQVAFIDMPSNNSALHLITTLPS